MSGAWGMVHRGRCDVMARRGASIWMDRDSAEFASRGQ